MTSMINPPTYNSLIATLLFDKGSTFLFLWFVDQKQKHADVIDVIFDPHCDVLNNMVKKV